MSEVKRKVYMPGITDPFVIQVDEDFPIYEQNIDPTKPASSNIIMIVRGTPTGIHHTKGFLTEGIGIDYKQNWAELPKGRIKKCSYNGIVLEVAEE